MMLIGIDHGNKQMKTVHCKPFVSGLQQSTTKPFGKDVLYYKEVYYTLMDQRIPYRKDKTEDDRFFVLTLFALAGELAARGYNTGDVLRTRLAVGLPPAHFGAQAKRFTEYFQGRGIITFSFNGKGYEVYIEDVACFPQAYAAAATMLYQLMDDTKAVILDIGGFTADYLLLKNGQADLSTCDSLENGVILLYNRIRSKANAELDILLDENDVDIILQGKGTDYPEPAISLVEQQAQQFVGDLFSTLRERMLDLRFMKVVFVGGGAILLRKQIEASGKVGTPLFVDDINANAKGYEYLYQIEMAGR
jgi:plasmid segregation protein ParM